jgi:hypothetical protein
LRSPLAATVAMYIVYDGTHSAAQYVPECRCREWLGGRWLPTQRTGWLCDNRDSRDIQTRRERLGEPVNSLAKRGDVLPLGNSVRRVPALFRFLLAASGRKARQRHGVNDRDFAAKPVDDARYFATIFLARFIAVRPD